MEETNLETRTIYIKSKVISIENDKVSLQAGITFPMDKLEFEIDTDDLEKDYIFTFTDTKENIHPMELICSAFVCDENGHTVVDDTSKRKPKSIKKKGRK